MQKFLINDFEGPLDLLLHLLKQSKMNIYEINIVEITHQYINYIKAMEEMNLDIDSEYLIMAAELIEMKSRYLLPNKNEVEDSFEENSEDELKKRLLEYQKYKESIDKFKELENIRHEVYTKSPERILDLTETKMSNNENIGVFDLLNALEKVIERLEYNKPMTTKVTKRELSVKDRVIKIREILKNKKTVKFEELFESMNKEYIIVTFLSILNMARDKEINLIQKNNFDEIFIERVN